MTIQRAALIGGWSGSRAEVNRDDGAANTAAVDPINILDTVEVPIVVLRRDLLIAGACLSLATGIRDAP